MKYAALMVIALSIAGCTETTGDVVNGFETACLDGVLYYVDKSGYGTSLAPVVDSKTLTFVRCK
jgi:hypothetical protein